MEEGAGPHRLSRRGRAPLLQRSHRAGRPARWRSRSPPAPWRSFIAAGAWLRHPRSRKPYLQHHPRRTSSEVAPAAPGVDAFAPDRLGARGRPARRPSCSGACWPQSRIPEMGYRSCLGILAAGQALCAARVEAACAPRLAHRRLLLSERQVDAGARARPASLGRLAARSARRSNTATSAAPSISIRRNRCTILDPSSAGGPC